MISGSLAKRYARALNQLASTPQQRDRYLQNLEDFSAACKNLELIKALSAAHHKLADRRAILHGVLRRLNADPIVVQFLELVLERGRIVGIEQIFLHYRELADEAAGRMRATIKTATRLDPATEQRIRATLEQATGKQVLLSVQEDPELIGGLVAHIGSYTLDRSVRTSLARLRSSLAS